MMPMRLVRLEGDHYLFEIDDVPDHIRFVGRSSDFAKEEHASRYETERAYLKSAGFQVHLGYFPSASNENSMMQYVYPVNMNEQQEELVVPYMVLMAMKQEL